MPHLLVSGILSPFQDNIPMNSKIQLLLLSALSSHAAIVASDSFDYGNSGGNLIGQNGGSGFSSPWTETYGFRPANPSRPWQYDPAGLTFGSLPTSGGSALFASISTLPNGQAGLSSRNLPATLSGNIYTSFLFRPNSRPEIDNTTAVLLGNSTDLDTNSTFAFSAPDFNLRNANLRIEGQRNSSGFAGTNWTAGETYLALYSVSTVTQSGEGWIMSVDQYENFKDSLDAATLNAATLGTGASQILQRGSYSRPTANLGPINAISLFGAFDVQSINYDELKVSGESLDEAVKGSPVPEPSSALLALLGAATFFLRRR